MLFEPSRDGLSARPGLSGDYAQERWALHSQYHTRSLTAIFVTLVAGSMTQSAYGVRSRLRTYWRSKKLRVVSTVLAVTAVPTRQPLLAP